MDVFNYHPETGEYLSHSPAHPNPLEPGNWLVPAFATTIAPPAQKPGTANVFKDGAWTQIEDHRGEKYWFGATLVKMTGLGAVPPELSSVPPKRWRVGRMGKCFAFMRTAIASAGF